ncbi:MAG: efflux RND transporter periplasmic adaptor subunit [Candidatus Sericytochromatia bacterium]
MLSLKNIVKPLLIISLIAFSGCSKKENKEKKDETKTSEIAPALTVSTEKVSLKEIEKILNVTGSIAAWDLLNIKASSNGLKIMEVYSESGDYVKKGQILVKLDDSMLQAQLQSAKARLTNVEAQLKKIKNPNRNQDIATQKALIDQIQASLDNAKTTMDRFDNLYKQGAVSKADYDLRKTTYDTTEAQLRQAKERLSLMLEGSREEDIKIAEASVADTKAQIQQLNVQLSQTSIYAPDDGLIMERFAKLGDVSSSAVNLFTIVRNNRFEFQAKVPEIDIKNIKVGDEVKISSDANPLLKTKGKIRQIGPGIDQVSRQTTVRIDVDYVKGLQAGQFVKGTVNIGKIQAAVIPAKSIISLDGLNKVFLVNKDSVVTSKTVKTGENKGSLIQILSGLSPEDEVITQGAGFLKDGDKVKVVK